MSASDAKRTAYPCSIARWLCCNSLRMQIFDASLARRIIMRVHIRRIWATVGLIVFLAASFGPAGCVIEICMFHPSLGRLNVATWKRLTDVEKSDLEIDLDTIAFMRRNGNGTDITLDTGQTLTVRESPEDVRKRPRQLVF